VIRRRSRTAARTVRRSNPVGRPGELTGSRYANCAMCGVDVLADALKLLGERLVCKVCRTHREGVDEATD